jgi:DNA-binding transcriptional LysR family regulator
LAKASVSTAVQQLETQLGTRLLHRTTRRVSLSQDGRVLYERAQDLIHDLDELTTLFQAEGAALRGRLRVDMPVAVARDVVIPALPQFLAAHPELELELSSTDRLVDIVREGFDCVLRVGSRADSSSMVRTLGHYRVVNCASPGYIERFGLPTSVTELADHQLVHYTSTLGDPADEFEYIEPGSQAELSVPMRGAFTVNNSAAYLAACLAGLGIIQVPVVGVMAELAKRELVELLPGLCPAPMPVSWLSPNRRHLPRRTRVCMDWIAGLLSPHLGSAESPRKLRDRAPTGL